MHYRTHGSGNLVPSNSRVVEEGGKDEDEGQEGEEHRLVTKSVLDLELALRPFPELLSLLRKHSIRVGQVVVEHL